MGEAQCLLTTHIYISHLTKYIILVNKFRFHLKLGTVASYPSFNIQ